MGYVLYVLQFYWDDKFDMITVKVVDEIPGLRGLPSKPRL